MPDDPAEQARNVYATFAEVLKEAGAELADIVRLRTYVTDAAFCEPVLKAQGEVFRRDPAGGDDRRGVRFADAGDEGRDRGGRAHQPARLISSRQRKAAAAAQPPLLMKPSGRLLDPQVAIAGRRDVAVDHLAACSGRRRSCSRRTAASSRPASSSGRACNPRRPAPSAPGRCPSSSPEPARPQPQREEPYGGSRPFHIHSSSPLPLDRDFHACVMPCDATSFNTPMPRLIGAHIFILRNDPLGWKTKVSGTEELKLYYLCTIGLSLQRGVDGLLVLDARREDAALLPLERMSRQETERRLCRSRSGRGRGALDRSLA